MEFAWIYMIIINLISFFLAVFDKKAAVRHRRRVPERTLFIAAIMGGSVGLYLSMLIFRHKTKHASFMIGVPVIIALQLSFLWFFFWRS